MRCNALYRFPVAVNVIGLLFMGWLVGCLRASDDSARIATKVTYIGGELRSVLITFINNGKHVVRIADGRLPWRHRYAMVMLGVNSETGGVVEASVPPIDDPVAAVVEIAPGEAIQGEVSLKEIYPTLDDELASARIDVFYAFDIKCIEGPDPQRVGGWFSVPSEPARVKSTH